MKAIIISKYFEVYKKRNQVAHESPIDYSALITHISIKVIIGCVFHEQTERVIS